MVDTAQAGETDVLAGGVAAGRASQSVAKAHQAQSHYKLPLLSQPYTDETHKTPLPGQGSSSIDDEGATRSSQGSRSDASAHVGMPQPAPHAGVGMHGQTQSV